MLRERELVWKKSEHGITRGGQDGTGLVIVLFNATTYLSVAT